MGTTTTNYGLYKPAIGETGWGALVNTSKDTIDTTMKVNEDAIALNTTHRSSDGSDHTFIDQSVISGASPTFGGINFTGMLGANVNIVDAGGYYTATDVEGALQENRPLINTNTTNIGTNATAIGLNTTHRTSDGSDHTFIDQSVVSGGSPTFDGNNFTGIDADDVDIADAGAIITATDVEGALQENRTAVNLNTTHRGLAAPHREINDSGTSSTELWSSSKISSVVQGLDWQDSVLDRYDPTGGLPGGPSTGDRYIATATANGWTIHYIYEYNGATWDETIPNEGYAVWVEDEDKLYVFNGTIWVLFGSTIDHTTLSSIGSNTHAQIDSHISGTGADHSYIDQSVVSGASPTFGADNLSDGGGNAIITTTQETNFETAYTHASSTGSDHSLVNSSLVSAINFVLDGGGAAITTGIKGDVEIPFACTINQVTLLADQSTTTTIDIWKDTYANFPPTDADSITAAAVPGIVAGLKDQDSTLTGWTVSVSAGDILRFNVDANDNAERVTLSLKVTKT